MDTLNAARARLTRPRWLSWRQLPRESRDMLFLLALTGWTVLPHAQHLPLWSMLLSALLLVWRGALALGSRPLPARVWMLALLALVIGLTLWTHRTLLGKEAGVTLLVLLMVLKTLEMRARRDALVLFFLGFFVVLTNFLYSQSLLVAAAMLVSVWGLLTALVLAHMPVGQPALRHAGALAARAALFGTPVMVALFLFFPRLAPLWGLPQDGLASTGLSGSLRLGGVAELASDDSIAFRVRFDGAAPAPQWLYWRGPVLTLFDGREWRRLPEMPTQRAPDALRVIGAPLRYEMTLEPLRLPLLPLLEATPDAPGSAPRLNGLGALLRSDLQWVTAQPVSDRLSLRSQAWLRFELDRAGLPLRERQEALRLPAGFNPRTQAWALALRNEPRLAGASPSALVRAVLDEIRRSDYTYTLTPGTYGDESGRHAVDEFWLDRKRGFCEHFATAFVVIMRALDVPARVVTGYQGADAQPQDGWLVVRQNHAHAWAEVWLAGRGWQRVDPTAAVAPERIEHSNQLRPAPGLLAAALGAFSPTLLSNLRETWERVNNRWNLWVLSYSRSQQFRLLENLGFDAPRWEYLLWILVSLLCGATALGLAWAWWDRKRRDPWERLQARVRSRLAGLGIAAAAFEAPRTLAARARQQRGETAEPLAALLDALDRQRYDRSGPRAPQATWWRAFRRAAAALRRS